MLRWLGSGRSAATSGNKIVVFNSPRNADIGYMFGDMTVVQQERRPKAR